MEQSATEIRQDMPFEHANDLILKTCPEFHPMRLDSWSLLQVNA